MEKEREREDIKVSNYQPLTLKLAETALAQSSRAGGCLSLPHVGAWRSKPSVMGAAS